MDECGWDSPKFNIVFGRPCFVNWFIIKYLC